MTCFSLPHENVVVRHKKLVERRAETPQCTCETFYLWTIANSVDAKCQSMVIQSVGLLCFSPHNFLTSGWFQMMLCTFDSLLNSLWTNINTLTCTSERKTRLNNFKKTTHPSSKQQASYIPHEYVLPRLTFHQ